jgi:hypothetical protein
MTKDESLHALKAANAERNIGAFKSRIERTVRLLDGCFLDAAILAELKIAYRRLRRERLLESSTDPRCECGHELAWHDNGLACAKCNGCSVFRPVDEGPQRQEEAKPTTTRQIREAEIRRQARNIMIAVERARGIRPMPGAAPQPNPWEERIAEQRKKRQDAAAPPLPQDAVIPKLKPGASAHLRGKK